MRQIRQRQPEPNLLTEMPENLAGTGSVGGRVARDSPLQFPGLRIRIQIEPTVEVLWAVVRGQFDGTSSGKIKDELAQQLTGSELPRDQFLFPGFGKVVDGEFQQHATNALRVDVPTFS